MVFEKLIPSLVPGGGLISLSGIGGLSSLNGDWFSFDHVTKFELMRHGGGSRIGASGDNFLLLRKVTPKAKMHLSVTGFFMSECVIWKYCSHSVTRRI